MPVQDLRFCRSLLFLPASNPRAIEKARSLDADLVILDLEDAVADEHKGEARAAAVAAVRTGFGGRPAAIRANAIDSAHFAADAEALRDSNADYLILPKAGDAEQLAETSRRTGKPVLAMVETPRGVIASASIASACQGLIAGTNDLAAELRLPPQSGRSGLVHSLQQIVLAARAAGIPAFDGVCNLLADEAALESECAQGRTFGFDGKTVIHPNQIGAVNRIFSPDAAEVEAARRLVAAAGGGAERFEGRMIESMHVEQARALLELADRRGSDPGHR